MIVLYYKLFLILEVYLLTITEVNVINLMQQYYRKMEVIRHAGRKEFRNHTSRAFRYRSS